MWIGEPAKDGPEQNSPPHEAADTPRRAVSGTARDANPARSGSVAERRCHAGLSMPLAGDFLQHILSADERSATVALPGGGTMRGRVSQVRRDADGLLLVQGEVFQPEAGRFMFQRQTIRGKAGPLAGFIHYDRSETAWQVRPAGENGAPVLVKTTADAVICRSFTAPPADVWEIPADHPVDDPIPPGENGIVQLQSLPGATAVIYLDFDGEERDFDGWGQINARPFSVTPAQIHQVWQGVCEDFQPFRINVTTVRAVYDAAPPGHRMQVIITPDDDAAPGFGGVAMTGSFNWTGGSVCWAFRGTGKNAIEIISHEVGHTLGLSHDGLASPANSYYSGHNGWAPIMGIGYYQPLTQWSKGEYPNASNTQDDLSIIANDNNGVEYRDDDHRSTYLNATWLDIAAGGAVYNEGLIRNRDDRDSFRFSTGGGPVTLAVNTVPDILPSPFFPVSIANLDITAEILTAGGALVATSSPADSSAASFASLNLAAGDYFLRVSGSGRGDLTSGYSDYASLGSYTITGTVTGGVHADHFTLAENSATDTTVGSVASRASHGAGVPSFTITAGNDGGAFAINPATGAITVANAAAINFEALSTQWDDPAAFTLLVTITDSLGFLTESIRAIVSLTDVNEPPVFSAPPELTLPDKLPTGSLIVTATATDPDRGDYVTHSIIAGNEGGLFAIDAATGAITLAAPPDFGAAPVHQLVLRATDHRAPAHEVDAPLTIRLLEIPAAYAPGSILRTYYNGIGGSAVADLTGSARFPDKPETEESLTSFDSGTNRGDFYGSTLCGYLIAPASGDYTFWISANDSGELLISPDADPANAVRRASLTTRADPGEWSKFPSQKSAAIPLTAGGVYYIEARQKESLGGDHVQVAWQGPGMATAEIIPGRWLAPHHRQYAPWSPDMTHTVREAAAAGTLVGRVSFLEPNTGQRIAHHAITAGNEAGRFMIDAASGEIRVASADPLIAGSSHVLTVSATDDGSPAMTGSANVTVQVLTLDQQLHAWWRLDETADTTVHDSSGNNRHADLTGGGAWVARGATGRALQLNGSDARFTHADFEALTGNVAFTVAAWVKVPASHAADGVLIQQTAASVYGGPGRYRVTVKADGRVNFSVHGWDEAYTEEGDQFQITSPQTIHDGSWHHLACVRDGGAGRIFIDGIECAGASGTIRLLEFEGATTVGCDAAANTAYLNATVDDVRVYAEALASPQIAKIAAVFSPFAAWQVAEFEDLAADPLVGGELADPDRDGLCNLLEYALGSAPKAASAAGMIPEMAESGFMRLTIRRNPAATDVTFSVEGTADPSDPASWSATGIVMEENTPERLVVLDTLGGPRRFFRLRVGR